MAGHGQYKLRLRDGTILAVDEQGLRTWLLDDKAMVQPPGARAWWPLRDVMAELAAQRRDAVKAPRAEPVAPPSGAGPAEAASVARPARVEPEEAQTESLLDVAAAEVERHSGERTWQWHAGAPRMTPAKDHDLQELDLVEENGMVPPAPTDQALRAGFRAWPAAAPWVKRGLLAAGLVVLAVMAVSMWPASKPMGVEPAAALRPSGAVPAATLPRVTPEVEALSAKLPHLAPETVQLVLSRSEFGPLDAPEVFRRAHAAADGGLSALTEPEAHELAALRTAVLAPLRRGDRERVRAYDRVRSGRELMPGEDARVLGLFARGTRSLPAPRRERLQALLAKAIASALGPPPRASKP